VTCVSSSDCWTVGLIDVYQTDIVHWDGTSWQTFPTPDLHGTPYQYIRIQSIACASSSQCWVVGWYYNDADFTDKTFIQHWDGLSWQVVASPNGQVNPNNFLNGVTCVSPSDCWVVGSNKSPTSEYTLVEHWDGSSWSIVPSADSGDNPPTNTLSSVTCVSSSDCWAVGTNRYYDRPPIIEHWNGTSWLLVNSASLPPAGNRNNSLQNVTCVSSTDCWAVGTYPNGTPHYKTLVERWNGVSWQLVSSPSINGTENGLYGVTCASAADCWTVGYFGGAIMALIEHWDGGAWSLASSPPNVTYSELFSVACTSASQCWSVGINADGNGSTLIEEYSAFVPPVLAVGSRKIHGDAGTFDVDLLSTSPGIECRSGGANGNYSVVFTFANNVTDCGSAGTTNGTVVPGPNPNQCTENLTGVTNAQYVNVALNTVVDSENNSGDVSVSMGVLIGDTNANGTVNAADVAQTKARLGQLVDQTNFRSDINANGSIGASDVAAVKSNVGTGLP
jgi:hypothetical protein